MIHLHSIGRTPIEVLHLRNARLEDMHFRLYGIAKSIRHRMKRRAEEPAHGMAEATP